MKAERVTLITLGVADMARARAFYQAWGWQVHSRSVPDLTLFQMNGLALALFDIRELAADQDRPAAPLGTGAVTLAQNMTGEAEVDQVFEAALKAGATPLEKPQKVFWGGYSSYVAPTPTAMSGNWPATRSGRSTTTAA